MNAGRLRTFFVVLIPMEAILFGLYLVVGSPGQAGAFWLAGLGLAAAAGWVALRTHPQDAAQKAALLRASRLLGLGGRDESAALQDVLGAVEDLIRSRQQEVGFLRAILETSPAGIVVVDGLGDVVLRNQAISELFALSETEMEASSLSKLLRHYQFVEMWRQAREHRRAQSRTEEVPQSRRTLQATVTPLSGELEDYALMLFQDISELRRLETVRRDFVSNVSHELRTPLASLKALTESLRAGALEEPDTAKRFLTHIETEVDALSELVAELLELARIESHRAPLQMAPTDACQVIRRAAQRLRLQAERAGLELAIECDRDLPRIQADATRLEQVLVNLIHNAVKFTPSGGRVIVSAEQSGEQVRFLVEDTGMGIEAEVLPRIFERFYKADPARNRGGTGLGLAISKHLVESHSGRIWAESQPGRGSRFYFTIPTI